MHHTDYVFFFITFSLFQSIYFLPSFVVLQYPPGSLLNLQMLLPHVAQSHKFPTQYPAKGMSFFFKKNMSAKMNIFSCHIYINL